VTFVPSGGRAPFQYAQSIAFSAVGGMTQINGQTGTITAVMRNSSGVWQVLVNINSASFGVYTGGGQAVANDAYTTLATWYQPGFAANGSYGCVVENVTIANFVVGIAIGLSGNSNLAADMTFRNVYVANCDVCYAIGQSQSRNLNIEYGNVTGARTGFDGLGYGTQTGTPPQLLRQNFGFLYRIFAFDTWIGNLVVEDGYAESIMSLGEFGTGEQPGEAALTFLGGDFGIGNPAWTAAPLVLETYAPTTFLGTGLGVTCQAAPEGLPVLNFIHQDSPITFDRCSFGGNATGHAPHIGLSRDAQAYCKFMDCWVSNPSHPFIISNDLGRSSSAGRFSVPPQSGRLEAVYSTYRVSDGLSETIYIPYTNRHQIFVGGVSNEVISGNTLTFNCSNYAQLQKNDILFWTILPQGYSGQSGYWIPAMQITNVDPATSIVTCALLFDPNQYAPTDSGGIANLVGVAPNHWAPTQPLTCSTTSGSSVLTGVSPVTILQNGDFVTGAGIQANTRVVSGGGTATVNISQTATTTASGVTLYFGRLNKVTLTPAY
jgi:hypothetical protein